MQSIPLELQRLPPRELLSLKLSLKEIGFLQNEDSDAAAAFVKCFARVLVCPPGKAECRYDDKTESMQLRYAWCEHALYYNRRDIPHTYECTTFVTPQNPATALLALLHSLVPAGIHITVSACLLLQ